MAMTPESLLLHADEDGKGISRRRASKNTARLLRLLHCFSISHPPFCVSFHDAITRVSGGLECSEAPMKRQKITVCEGSFTQIAIDLPGRDEQVGLTGVLTSITEVQPGASQVFPIKFEVCDAAGSSEYVTHMAIDLPGREEEVVITDELTVSEPKSAPALAFPIKSEPIIFLDGIKSSCQFTVEFDSSGVQHLRREYCNWEGVVGLPVQHMVPNNCALDAAAMCVEAQHRRVYERLHGKGSFPCRAAAPRELRRSCERKGLWDREKGARGMGPVLDQVKILGGIRTTNAPAPSPRLLPLSSWEEHHPDGFDGKFTEERLADLMDENGPCIGVIPFEWWYLLVDADVDDKKVYRSDVMPAVSEDPIENMAAAMVQAENRENERHAVLCCRYRNLDTGMHILVVDNRRRWVQSQDFLEIYTLQVEPMDPRPFDGRRIRYPLTGA